MKSLIRQSVRTGVTFGIVQIFFILIAFNTMVGIMHKYNAPPEMVREMTEKEAEYLRMSNIAKEEQRVAFKQSQLEGLKKEFGAEFDQRMELAARGARVAGLDPNDDFFGDSRAVKMALKYQQRPKVAPEFIPRTIDGKAEERLNAALAAREHESRSIAMLFEPDADVIAPEGGAENAGQQQQQQAASSGWTCAKCGQTGNTGKFCSNCGAPRPESGWTCAKCGQTGNTGKFCSNCGAVKPE